MCVGLNKGSRSLKAFRYILLVKLKECPITINFQIVIETPIRSFLIVVHSRSQHLKTSLIGDLNGLFVECYKRDISK